MTILSLLGKSLKDDDVIELLEVYRADVIYEFDRLHENSPDVYWASLKQAGIQFRFNEHQLLDTAFCYITPRNGFGTVSPESIGVPIFDSFSRAEQACQDMGVRFQTSISSGAWLKVVGGAHDAHYEFMDGRLSMVTLMHPWDEA
jgi:hypothetical protein